MMGYYIPCTENKNKVDQILASIPSRRISQEEAKSFIGTDKAVVCVVDNGLFEAAAYCYNEGEFEAFTFPEDNRPKVWIVIDDKDKIEKITGFKK
jgi:hypothetical protein